VEQVKLLATALNNVGVGFILAGAITPAVSGTITDTLHAAAWLIFGANLIAAAQGYLWWRL
jgi:hypothetical protein